MTWTPEPQPNVKETDQSKMEWLVRSFRKLSQWSRTRVPIGHGGMTIAGPVAPAKVLTTTYQKVLAFDKAMPQVALTSDLANHRSRIDERGIWFFYFEAAGEITPFSANAPQTIEVAVYNETKGVPYLVGYFSVPRYTDVFAVSAGGQVEIPGPDVNGYEIGDWISLWMRIRYATPAITVTTLEQLELSAFRVGA